MNERIRELAQQATTIEEHGWGASYENFDREKFAELIVKECISTLEETIYRPVDHEGDEIWIDDILKEHFGVK